MKWWQRIFYLNRRRYIYEQIQWQRFLLRTGIPATAQVLDLVEEGGIKYGYVQVRIWVVIKIKGAIVYRHLQTLLEPKQLPTIGETIHIRYCPDDMSKVLVL